MNIRKLEHILTYIDDIEKRMDESDGVEVHLIRHLTEFRECVTDELKRLVWAQYLKGEGQ